MVDLKHLNREQRAAVEHDKGPMLVVAGAGTGKTQVITYRVAYLIEKLKVKPSEILAVTFTDKAAREMEARISEVMGKYVLDVNITTFNSLGNDLLKRFAYDIGLTPNLKLLNPAQQVVFLKDHLDELALDYYAPVTNPEGLLAELAQYFSKLKSEQITPPQYTKFVQKLTKQANSDDERLEAASQHELALAYRQYHQLARQKGVVDYDDQVYLPVELLEKRPNLRAKLQAEIRYVLVDEFQDTNKSQSALIDLVVGQSRGGGNIMVVGDDDQSIYRFRGAALSNILEFKQRYRRAKQLPLLENYRSTQAILDSAHQLIQHNNPDRLEAKYGLDKRLRGQIKGKSPQLKACLSIEEEAEWVAADIASRLKKGQTASEIAILLRKNQQARILEKYLEKAGVDFIIIGQTSDLYQQPVVKLLLNFLRTVVEPSDNESLYHLLVSPVYQLDPAALRKAVASARRSRTTLEAALDDIPDLPSQQAKVASTLLDQLSQWRQLLPTISVGQLCYKFLEDSGYLHRLIREAKNEPSLDQDINQLNQFFTTLKDFEAVASDDSAVGYVNSLPALLGSGERLALEDLPDIYGQKVRLLTVHKAKGLEFEVVYLFDMTQGNFPARARPSSLEVPAELSPEPASLGANPQLQEERRLMYVAMTRAKRELIMSYSIDHGGKTPRKPSLFIGEALGEYPLLAQLPELKSRTSQIELFKARGRSQASSGSPLPPSFWDGETLILSEQQIETYLRCPAEFKLRYLIGPPQPLTFALEYGNLMHSLIQFYNRARLSKRSVKLTELMEFLKSNWPVEGFLTPGHEQRSLAQAKTTLRRFYQREQKAKHYPRYIERSFSCELDEFKAVIKGRFDAVYEDDGDVEIRDYKTGAPRVSNQAKANERTKSNLQLAIYALAWQRLAGQLPGRVSLDFIDSGWLGSATKTERQLQTVQQKIGRTVEGIRAGDFRPNIQRFGHSLIIR